ESPPRSDKFEIQSVKFQQQLPVFVDEEGVKKEDKKAFILSIARSSSLVIAVLAFLLFASKALKRIITPAPTQQAGYATYSAPPELEEYVDHAEVARQSRMSEKRVTARDGVIDNAKSDPRTTTNLVRKWLRENE
ncbi:MAG: hypothetical protein HOI47_10845, partial [Candidatus Scalindua sp.]|nr:hypothetical protein [Candidatus Scalindua sp.]